MACWVERGRACNLAAVAGKGFGPAEDRALRRMGWLPVGRRHMGWALLGHRQQLMEVSLVSPT